MAAHQHVRAVLACVRSKPGSGHTCKHCLLVLVGRHLSVPSASMTLLVRVVCPRRQYHGHRGDVQVAAHQDARAVLACVRSQAWQTDIRL